MRSNQVCWSPPQDGLFKANFDAAFFDSIGIAGIGVMVRDFTGNIIAALSQKMQLPHSVDLAEALARNRVVTFA